MINNKNRKKNFFNKIKQVVHENNNIRLMDINLYEIGSKYKNFVLPTIIIIHMLFFCLN